MADGTTPHPDAIDIAYMIAEARRFDSRDEYPPNYRWDLLIRDLADALDSR